jgi:hypothetical protein
MRFRRAWAAAVAIAILLAPLTALATTWAEWKFLMRRRPVAVFFAIPPLIVTSPFMGATWAYGKMTSHEGAKSDDSDDDDEDDDEE